MRAAQFPGNFIVPRGRRLTVGTVEFQGAVDGLHGFAIMLFSTDPMTNRKDVALFRIDVSAKVAAPRITGFNPPSAPWAHR